MDIMGRSIGMINEVGLAGYGYWGKNLARVLSELRVLQGIAEPNPERNIKATEFCGRTFNSLSNMLDTLVYLEAIVVATPPETHYDIALQALQAGKDVFIEKPMTTSYSDAVHLAEVARSKERNLMVGHIYLHNDGIKVMPIPVGKAELYVQLLNEKGGPSPSTRDVLWAALPHACSLALHFFPDMPEWIEAEREEERIKVILRYWNGSIAYLDVGDNTGVRRRTVELKVGDTRYKFNTDDHWLCKKESGVDVINIGDEKAPEPLVAECKVFLEYKGVDPLGPKVVKLIEEICKRFI